MIYALHHATALVLAALAALCLPRARWAHQRPRLALTLWQITALSIVVSLVGGLLAVGLAPYRQGVVPGLISFVTAPPDLLHAVAVVTGLAVAGWLLVHQARCAIRVARQRARHRDLLMLVAHGDEDALVLDHPIAVAYCLPGRNPRIVVSAGTRRLLTTDELGAVLAHERAHLRERHHLVLAPFSALAQLFPHGRVLGNAVTDVRLLIEMRADDHAARHHGRAALLGALEKFHAVGGGGAPTGALAAMDTPLHSRIERLRRSDRLALPVMPVMPVLFAVAAVTVLATPLSLFITPL